VLLSSASWAGGSIGSSGAGGSLWVQELGGKLALDCQRLVSPTAVIRLPPTSTTCRAGDAVDGDRFRRRAPLVGRRRLIDPRAKTRCCLPPVR